LNAKAFVIFFFSAMALANTDPRRPSRWIPADDCRGTVADVGFTDPYIRWWLEWIGSRTTSEVVSLIEFGAATGPVMINAISRFLASTRDLADGTKPRRLNPSRFYAVDLSSRQLEELRVTIDERYGAELRAAHLETITGSLPTAVSYPHTLFDGAATFRTLHFLSDDEILAFLNEFRPRLQRGAPFIATVESLFLPIVPEIDRQKHLTICRREGVDRPFRLEKLPEVYSAITGSQGHRYLHTVESLSRLFRLAGFEVLHAGYIRDRYETFPDSLIHHDPALKHLNFRLSLGIVAWLRPRGTRLRNVFQSDLEAMLFHRPFDPF